MVTTRHCFADCVRQQRSYKRLMLDQSLAKVTTILGTAPRLGYLPCGTIQRGAWAVTPGVMRGQVAGSSRFHTSTPRSSPPCQSPEGESCKIKPCGVGGVLSLRSRRELAGHHEEHEFNLVAKAGLDQYSMIIPHLSGVSHRAGPGGLAPHYPVE